MPDDAALLLGIEHILQAREKHFRGVADGERDAELAGENIFHPLALARAQQPIVDEHALETLADRAMNQRRRDRRIDAAGKSEQHLVARTDLVANLGDLGVDEVRHRPVAGLAANLMHEVSQQLRAARRMHDLGMKLDAANFAVLAAHRRARSIIGMRDGSQRRRKRLDAIAMAHPHAMLLAFEAFEQRILRVDLQRRRTVFLRASRAASSLPDASRRRTCRSRCRGCARRSSALRDRCPARSRRKGWPGPPDRMMPRGFIARIFASGKLNGWISQYTLASRTRRAINWVY